MGWSAKITADRELKDEDVLKALSEMTGVDCSVKPRQQEWGWSLECDVYKPEGKTLTIGGSWLSFKIADQFSHAVLRSLQKVGYHVERTRAK